MFMSFIGILFLVSLFLGYVVYKDAQTNPSTTLSPEVWFIVVAFFPIFGLLMYLILSQDGGGESLTTRDTDQSHKKITVVVSGEVQKPDSGITKVEMEINTNNIYEATTIFRDSCINKGYEPVGQPTIKINSIEE